MKLCIFCLQAWYWRIISETNIYCMYFIVSPAPGAVRNASVSSLSSDNLCYLALVTWLAPNTRDRNGNLTTYTVEWETEGEAKQVPHCNLQFLNFLTIYKNLFDKLTAVCLYMNSLLDSRFPSSVEWTCVRWLLVLHASSNIGEAFWLIDVNLIKLFSHVLNTCPKLCVFKILELKKQIMHYVRYLCTFSKFNCSSNTRCFAIFHLF